MIFTQTWLVELRNKMIPVGEIIGISVGVGVVTLGLIWASVNKWKAEHRVEKAKQRLTEGPMIQSKKADGSKGIIQAPRVLRSLTFSELPLGSRVDIESSWGGALARGVKLVDAQETLVDGKPVAVLTVLDSAGDKRQLTPILLDEMRRLRHVTFRESV